MRLQKKAWVSSEILIVWHSVDDFIYHRNTHFFACRYLHVDCVNRLSKGSICISDEGELRAPEAGIYDV